MIFRNCTLVTVLAAVVCAILLGVIANGTLHAEPVAVVQNAATESAPTQDVTVAPTTSEVADGLATTGKFCGMATPAGLVDADQKEIPIAEHIKTHVAEPDKICPLIAPLIFKTPSKAAEVIAAAQEQQKLMVPLAVCLSKLQQCIASKDPEGAKEIASLIATAPAEIQAAYATALDPGETGNAESGGVAGNSDSGGDGEAGGEGGEGGGGAPGAGGISLSGSGGAGGVSGDVSPSSSPP